MSKQLIPLLTTEVYRNLPDQATELINRLVVEVNDFQRQITELSNAIIALQQEVENIEPCPSPTDWIQIRQFNIENMGTTHGLCLQNTRLGFGIATGHFPTARADMESQIANGTLHSGLPPYGIAVPIYYDNSIAAGHVAVWDHGRVYSDGIECPNIDSVDSGYMGWGELCDNTRVVSPAV